MTKNAAPSSSLKKALALVAAGNWDGAHELVQDDGSPEAAWIHAHLHRIEGDLDNANYWYRKAGKQPAVSAFEEERRVIEQALSRE